MAKWLSSIQWSITRDASSHILKSKKLDKHKNNCFQNSGYQRWKIVCPKRRETRDQLQDCHSSPGGKDFQTVSKRERIWTETRAPWIDKMEPQVYKEDRCGLFDSIREMREGQEVCIGSLQNFSWEQTNTYVRVRTETHERQQLKYMWKIYK